MIRLWTTRIFRKRKAHAKARRRKDFFDRINMGNPAREKRIIGTGGRPMIGTAVLASESRILFFMFIWWILGLAGGKKTPPSRFRWLSLPQSLREHWGARAHGAKPKRPHSRMRTSTSMRMRMRMILSFSYGSTIREGVGHWLSMWITFERQD